MGEVGGSIPPVPLFFGGACHRQKAEIFFLVLAQLGRATVFHREGPEFEPWVYIEVRPNDCAGPRRLHPPIVVAREGEEGEFGGSPLPGRIGGLPGLGRQQVLVPLGGMEKQLPPGPRSGLTV